MPREPGPKQDLCANMNGFSLHAAVGCSADDRKALEQLCRYITRPALANGRVPEMPAPLDINSTYCTSILGNAVQGPKKTMLRPGDTKDYSKHIDKLNDLCKAVGAGFKP